MHKSNQRFLKNRLFQYMLPGLIMAVTLQLWKVVDTILTGMLDGTVAMSAITLSLPIETLIQLPGFSLGVGGSLVAGRMLAARNNKGASQVMTFTMIVTLAIGLLFSAASFIAAEPIAALLANKASGFPLNLELYEEAKAFIFINMLGAPVVGIGILITSYMGIEKGEKVATAYIISANMMNFLIDIALLKLTHLGVKGAAIATICGFLFAMAAFVPYFHTPDLKLKLVKPDKSLPFDLVMRLSKPSMYAMLSTFCAELGVGLAIVYLIAGWGIPIFTVCRNIILITEILIAGFISLAPMLGRVMRKEFDYIGTRTMSRETLFITTILALLMVVVSFIIADNLVELYAIDEAMLPFVDKFMKPVVRLFAICLPLSVWNAFFAGYYESLGKKKFSGFISILTGGLIMIPCLVIGVQIGKLTANNGIYSLAFAYVMSEAVVLIVMQVYRRINFKGSGMLMIPYENPGTCLDISIKAELESTPDIPVKIITFCKANGVKKRICNFAAVAAEEMVVNSIKFGGKSSQWVDICIVLNGDKLILRIRDKGIPFNPTEYEFDNTDNSYDITGIQLVKLVSSHISYMRVVNMNNTVIEFDDVKDDVK